MPVLLTDLSAYRGWFDPVVTSKPSLIVSIGLKKTFEARYLLDRKVSSVSKSFPLMKEVPLVNGKFPGRIKYMSIGHKTSGYSFQCHLLEMPDHKLHPAAFRHIQHSNLQFHGHMSIGANNIFLSVTLMFVLRRIPRSCKEHPF